MQYVKGGWETGERTLLAEYPDLITFRTMGGGFTWETQDRGADVAAARAAWEEAKALMADPEIHLLLLDELNIVLRYDYLPDRRGGGNAEGAAAGPACRGHRPQRQAGADRGRRSGHRDDHGEASLPLRREGADGDRVLTMATAAIMFQGTGSDVGKSLIVAGLARAFTRRQLRVRPFKPQNMSNNAAVTADGGEIGRAQALQARACGVAPSVHMNPVLLKPQTDIGAQVVVQGRMQGTAKAAEYHALKPQLMPKVLESYERLGAEADLILVEGAGSPAEINLRAATSRTWASPARRRCPSC